MWVDQYSFPWALTQTRLPSLRRWRWPAEAGGAAEVVAEVVAEAEVSTQVLPEVQKRWLMSVVCAGGMIVVVIR